MIPFFSGAARVAGALLLACFTAGPSAGAVEWPGDAPPSPVTRRVELHFEIKVLLRGQRLGRRVAVDQWAGGRLLMAGRNRSGAMRWELVRPLEHPWTFRWYPTKKEIKLGAAIAVAEPSGDPYGHLAALATPLAREKYRQWWDADRIVARGPPPHVAPAWSGRAEFFWAEAHRRERREKDPLHRHPVYPFYVLGDPAGRVAFEVGRRGRLHATSIVERMSEPWLAQGWSDWLAGKRTAGYGYWKRGRPAWEPRTYQTLAAALRLLAWPVPERGSAGGRIEAGDLAGELGRVLVSLMPRARERIDWSGSPSVEFERRRDLADGRAWVGDSGDLPLTGDPDIAYRVWRFTLLDGAGEVTRRDEVQLFAAHVDRPGTLKVWVRIGYHEPTSDP